MKSKIKITELTVQDIRFPTSREFAGSDAMNKDPDYSAAYVTLHTNDPKLKGYGLTFTIGRGNELCVAAINALRHLIVGKDLSTITEHMGEFWQQVTGDSQLRWLGPDKGVIHISTAAVVNAVWDLWARRDKKPLWRLIVDMSPEELVRCLDFSYITDALTPDEALEILRRNGITKGKRIAELLAKGYPAYTTSAGWLGYSEEKMRQLCEEAVASGWNYLKFKVGADIDNDIRRLRVAREVLGQDKHIMVDANQKWDVNQAINWMKRLAEFNPWWIEEPTSPDDILGHAKIREAIKPIKVATGEHCHNRIMFKQLLQAKAIDFCQIDSCRLGGVNEILTVLLMAAKFNIPVCPHAGGVGLCEYVQHLAMVDYIYISGSLENRVLEYVDHLHEHFRNPVVVVNGHYQVPTAPGYSIEMKESSLSKFHYPHGEVWKTQ
jgi:L-fuconate dehydratase